MAAIPARLILDIPHVADRDLGGNSRAYWRTKYNKLKANKDAAWAFTLEALTRAGTFAGEFLTHDQAYTTEQIYPVQLVFTRYYSGTAKEWDDDNLTLAYKGFRDGICAGLGGINDRLVRTRVEQIRVMGPSRLGIEIIPAWNGFTNPNPNQVMQKLGVI